MDLRFSTGPNLVSQFTLKHCSDQLTNFHKHLQKSLEFYPVPTCVKTSITIQITIFFFLSLTSAVMPAFQCLVLAHLKAITNLLLEPLQFA